MLTSHFSDLSYLLPNWPELEFKSAISLVSWNVPLVLLSGNFIQDDVNPKV